MAALALLSEIGAACTHAETTLCFAEACSTGEQCGSNDVIAAYADAESIESC